MKNKTTIFLIKENLKRNCEIIHTIEAIDAVELHFFSCTQEAELAMTIIKPELLIVDIDFKDLNEKQKSINLIGYKLPAIVLSNDANKSNAVELIRKGAVDFFLKTGEGLKHELKKSILEITDVFNLRSHLKAQKNKARKSLRNAFMLCSATFIFITFSIYFLN